MGGQEDGEVHRVPGRLVRGRRGEGEDVGLIVASGTATTESRLWVMVPVLAAGSVDLDKPGHRLRVSSPTASSSAPTSSSFPP